MCNSVFDFNFQNRIALIKRLIMDFKKLFKFTKFFTIKIRIRCLIF